MKEAIVLAGGLGTRLRSVVPDLPKPMAPVAGRPFLELLLGSLEARGFGHVVLSLGYKAGLIVDHFGERFGGITLKYAVESAPLGTGGALRQSLSLCVADHVFVFNGDTFLDLDFALLEAQWQRHRHPIIVGRQVEDTQRYGRLSVDGGRVTRIESGVSGPGLINAGCYVLPADILASGPALERFSFETEFLAGAVTHSHFEIVVSGGHFIDIGIPEDYLRAQTELQHLVR